MRRSSDKPRVGSARPLVAAAVGMVGLLASMLAPRAAGAQTPEEVAQALFTEGRLALEKRDYAVACTKFAASLKLVRRAGSLINVAQCLERDGKLLAALKHWKEGVDQLPPGDDRLPPANERMEQLSARIPRLSVILSPGSEGLVVRIDVADFAATALPAEVPLDPGDHQVTVSGPGKEPKRFAVRLSEREHRKLHVDPAPSSPQQPSGAPPPRQAPGSSPMRTAGFVIGGVGVAGVLVAVVTGAVLLGKDATIEEQCPQKRCTPEGRKAIDGTGGLLVGNAFGWGVGAVGLGLGTTFILLGGPSAPARSGLTQPGVSLRVGPSSAAVAGSF